MCWSLRYIFRIAIYVSREGSRNCFISSIYIIFSFWDLEEVSVSFTGLGGTGKVCVCGCLFHFHIIRCSLHWGTLGGEFFYLIL